MGKKAPAPPPAVDPVALANAQAASNQQTAAANQKLGMVNAFGPDGSVTFRADPNSPAGYSQYTELSTDQQNIYNLGNQATAGAYQTAVGQLGRVNSALGQQLNAPDLQYSTEQANLQRSIAPAVLRGSFNQGGRVQSGYDAGGPLTSSFDQGQAIQGNVGPTDFSADRDAVTQSEFDRARSRLDPMWRQAEDKNRLRLSNQGLSQNSTAYKNSMDDFGRARNDAYDTALSSAVRAGSDQQQRLFDQSVQKGAFANNAAGQQYTQNMGAAQFGNNAQLQDAERNQQLAAFGNQAVGQRYAQNLGAADFSNQAANTNFANNLSAANFGNAAEQQAFNNRQAAQQAYNAASQQNFGNLSYAQNLPIQQMQALLGTGQVNMPGAYNGPVAQQAGVDVLGANALAQQSAQNAYNQQMQNYRANNQALGGLAGSILQGPFSGFFNKPATS